MLKRADQRGFTLVELSVAMSIMLLVAGALLGALESGTNAERRASTRIDDEQAVRVVLAQLTRDVRNASALLPGTTPDEIDLAVGGGHIRWAYDATAGVLNRLLVDDLTSTVHGGVSVGRLTNPPGSVFAVLASDSTNLFTLAGAGPADALGCASTVEASVTSRAHPPSKPFSEKADAPVHAALDRRGCP